MPEIDFETTLKEHESLFKFIKYKEISTLRKLPEKKLFSNEFIEWVTPTYYSIFTTIFTQYVGSQKESKIVAVINNPRYCNLKTEKKINEFVLPHLRKSLENAVLLKARLQKDKRDLINIIEVSALVKRDVLSYVNKAIFKRCKSGDVDNIKEQITDIVLDICDMLKHSKASQEIEFNAFNTVLESLRSLEITEEQTLRLSLFKKKSKSSQNKYIIISVIIFCVILLKFIGGLFG